MVAAASSAANPPHRASASPVSARVLLAAPERPHAAESEVEGYQHPSRHPAAPATRPLPRCKDDAGAYVLVVDDDKDILTLIRMVLEEEGYRVITAENGEQALGRTAQQQPDLILLDLTMPVLNGWQTRERLAETWPQIPVVFMTAGFRAKAEAEAYRVAGYLAKPFDVDDLLRTVSRFLTHE
jgi:CheY-like chemotaxis protein